jgi:hypothetical protein
MGGNTHWSWQELWLTAILKLPKLETATMTVVEVTVTRHLKLLDMRLPDLSWGFDDVLQLYDRCRYRLLIGTTVICKVR